MGVRCVSKKMLVFGLHLREMDLCGESYEMTHEGMVSLYDPEIWMEMPRKEQRLKLPRVIEKMVAVFRR